MQHFQVTLNDALKGASRNSPTIMYQEATFFVCLLTSLYSLNKQRPICIVFVTIIIQIQMQRLAKNKTQNKVTKAKDLDEETLNELKEAFKIFDSKNTGEIDARELKAIMKAFGMEIKKQDVRDIYAELGKDIKEGLNFNEFQSVMTSRMGPRDSKDEILKIFKLFDEDNLNKITFKNLKRIAAEVGQKIPDDELKEMLEQADRDGDGMLNFQQFYRIMRRRGDPLDDFDSDDE